MDLLDFGHKISAIQLPRMVRLSVIALYKAPTELRGSRVSTSARCELCKNGELLFLHLSGSTLAKSNPTPAFFFIYD